MPHIAVLVTWRANPVRTAIKEPANVSPGFKRAPRGARTLPRTAPIAVVVATYARPGKSVHWAHAIRLAPMDSSNATPVVSTSRPAACTVAAAATPALPGSLATRECVAVRADGRSATANVSTPVFRPRTAVAATTLARAGRAAAKVSARAPQGSYFATGAALLRRVSLPMMKTVAVAGTLARAVRAANRVAVWP